MEETSPVDISPADPFLLYLLHAGGPVDLKELELDSPAVRDLRAAGVALVVPLVTNGELIGTLNLGPRLSEQGYSSDDRKLLDTLAGYAAPAMRVNQLVRDRESQARNVERIEQELRVAQLIQQQFLPTELPDLPGYHVAAFYRPARTIGGDFYDFARLADGRLMFICGDVTDKGVPAALVMASTHALLREASSRMLSPGDVLARVNDLLYADIPPHMFVTCCALVLDPRDGDLVFANAGHNLPYVRTDLEGGVRELTATGMPLGLMPGMQYDEVQDRLAPGECILLHSDGLAEAHDENRKQMFGFDRLSRLVGESSGGEKLIDTLLMELAEFTGPDVEQEDDITFVTLERSAGPFFSGGSMNDIAGNWYVLDEFAERSEPGRERQVEQRVRTAVAALHLASDELDRLGTAVAETVMNAIEHGNHNEPTLPVEVCVRSDGASVEVLVSDNGGLRELPENPPIPDLDAKLAGLQTPRGWGLFLIRSMIDEMDVIPDPDDPSRHTARLLLRLADPVPGFRPSSSDHSEHSSTQQEDHHVQPM